MTYLLRINFTVKTIDMNEKCRCNWHGNDAQMIRYHDEEWGVPLFDDQKLFEFLILETFQAGLSWRTVLHKRENFRNAFDNFDVVKVANFNERKYNELVQDAGIIRNKLKIKAAISNAQSFMKIQEEFGSFSAYIWSFVNEKPIVNRFACLEDVPATTPLSDKISVDLKKRGFKFVGSTVIYAHMQATGMVNDHIVDCFRYNAVQL